MNVKTNKIIDGKAYLLWGNSEHGRKVYFEAGPVAVQLQKLEQNIHRCFHHRTLYNKLKTLKDTTSVFVSQSHSARNGHQLCRMNIPGSQVNYFLKDGAAFITRLVLRDSDYQADVSLMQAPGPYRIEKKPDGWLPDSAETKISTLHASVNGEVEELTEVMQFMPGMIKRAYNGEQDITGTGKRRGFTHLYMPGKNSKKYGWRDMVSAVPVPGSKKMAAAKQSLIDRTAACIEIAARASDEVKWTVQGSGSEIFCDAIEQLRKNQPGLSLERQQVCFFNPHTNPMRIKSVVEAAGGEQNYASSFKSRQNISAMAKGHRRYTEEKMENDKRENPGASQLAERQHARKMETMAFGAKGMAVTISGFVTTTAAAINNPGAVVGAVRGAAEAYYLGLQNSPVLTIGMSMLGAAAAYKSVTVTTPKMIALGGLSLAAIKGDRRLDQLTESSTLKAYDQLNSLRLGLAI